tara:strand:- start:5269 stop:5514 length:246 start_codon:yes stop_codon:yes gene_type:complete
MDLINPDPAYTRIAELRKQLIQSRLLCLALLCSLAFATGLYAREKRSHAAAEVAAPPVEESHDRIPDRIIRPRNRPKNTVA